MRSEHEPEPIAVAIVSGDPLVRSALASSLRDHPQLEVVAEPAQAEVVLWDPGMDPAAEAGLPRFREIASFAAPVAVLAFAPEHAGAALAAGARAVLARDVASDLLAAALVAIHRGLTVLDPSMRAALLDVQGADAVPAAAHAATPPRAGNDSSGGVEELTARELEVLQLLAAGMSNRAIAKRLAISEHTAKFHVNSILHKLGASSRTEAVVAAARRALVIL